MGGTNMVETKTPNLNNVFQKFTIFEDFDVSKSSSRRPGNFDMLISMNVVR